jgi:hypothetical protein
MVARLTSNLQSNSSNSNFNLKFELQLKEVHKFKFLHYEVGVTIIAYMCDALMRTKSACEVRAADTH